jgi:predicted GNAT family N-acyltransferase
MENLVEVRNPIKNNNFVEMGYLDFSEVWPLWIVCFDCENYNEKECNEEKKFYEAIKTCNGELFYIKNNNNVIATAIVTPQRTGSNHVLFISYVCVHPNFRNNGLGKQIVDHVVKYCKKLGASTVQLDCDKNMVDFYKKNNFSEIYVTMTHNF